MKAFAIPEEVSRITTTLEEAGYEAYLVGGCMRDLLQEKNPKDWDITTNAHPDAIQELFPETYYNNDFGTVGVVNETDDERLKVVEITPYRKEGTYSDSRRPDSIEFSESVEEDLARRDFTVNAVAYSVSRDTTVDPFGGQIDLANRTLRAVGDPKKRFTEDALRMLRAIRLAVELDFEIEPETRNALSKNALLLKHISAERIRDEFTRIINSPAPDRGIELLREHELLPFIVPELEEGIGIAQNQAHSFSAYEHTLKTLRHAADKEYGLYIRLAALFHDIAKPRTRKWSDEKNDWTFYGHEVVGAKMAKKRLKELSFSRETVDVVSRLVRWHMFFSDPEEVTLSAVRRMIRNVGEERIWDLMHLRACDRIGTGRPKEQPFRFRKYQSMIEEALRDPVSVGQLNIDGDRIMQVTGEQPGPRLGWMLHALLEEVLDEPEKNTTDYLENRVVELSKKDDEELRSLGETGKERKEQEEAAELEQLRNKYHVK